MSQIELMPLPVAAVQLEPALLPSVPSSAVPVTRATSPWSVNDSRAASEPGCNLGGANCRDTRHAPVGLLRRDGAGSDQ